MTLLETAGKCRQNWRPRINKYRVWTAAAVWVLAVVWLISGNSPLRGQREHYLAGEGSYGVDFDGTAPNYTQSFVPRYGRLKSVGIVVELPDNAEASGEVRLRVADAGGEVLAERSVAAEAFSHGGYTDVELDLELRAGHAYCLALESGLTVGDGRSAPQLLVCGTDYRLAENKRLDKGEDGQEELAGTQLLTRYIYRDAIAPGTLAQAMLVLGLAVLGIAAGLPADNRVRAVAAVFLLASGPYFLGRKLELLLPTNVLLPHAMKWNLGIMYLFELIVLLCTLSKRFTVVFCNVLLTVLYCANYFVYAFRGTYLKVNELSAIGTAADVVGRYSFAPNEQMAMTWCILAVFAVWGMCVGRVKRTPAPARDKGEPSPKRFAKHGRRIVCHCLGLALGIGLAWGAGHVLIDTELLQEHGFSYYSGINQEYTYYFDGYLVGSMLNIRYSRVTPPEGYSAERVEKILEEARGKAQGPEDGNAQELPHVILIMNESFSDLRVNGNLELSRENLNFIRGLRENTIQGYVNASVLGGGTANSEFEVFTGCTMGFLPDSYYAYQQAVTGPMDSMVTNLKEAGYTAYSMHPERALNWRRNVVYDYLGFETSLWREDFAGAEVIHSGVSDAETYRKVKELYENRKQGERLFIFDLTMQNHGYYRKTNVARTVEASNVDCDEADIYLSLIYESDRAFGELVEYFENQDERVIICMFGDHQPKFESETFYEDIYRQTEGLSEEDKKRNLYKTPFVIWANYDIPEARGLDISMNYLGVLLQQTAGVELTPYAAFLAEQMEDYPVITVNGYVDSGGNYSNWSGEKDEFLDYRMLQYNYLFDRNTVDWGY